MEDGYAARVMAAYIDLNPVRAGMVERPDNYKWCSYSEAMAAKAFVGRKKAREGYCILLAGRWKSARQKTQGTKLWNDGVAEGYRVMLFADGEEVFVEDINSGVAPGERELKRVRRASSARTWRRCWPEVGS